MATKEEQTAQIRLNEISDWNRETVNKNLASMNEAYDAADRQNKELLDTERMQNRQKVEADRFQAQRNLQNAARSLVNSVGNGLNSSAAGNIRNLLMDQQDASNVDYWTTLRQNQNAVENAYREAVNQNYLNRLEAGVNAEVAKRDIEANQSAQLQNLNPDLYVSPKEHSEFYGDDWQRSTDYGVGSSGTIDKSKAAADEARKQYALPTAPSGRGSSGYVTTATGLTSGNRSNINDYFSKLLRGV